MVRADWDPQRIGVIGSTKREGTGVGIKRTTDLYKVSDSGDPSRPGAEDGQTESKKDLLNGRVLKEEVGPKV